MDKEKISEFKNDLRSKNEHFTEANLFNNELKIQIKSLKSQIENKNEELLNTKKEFDKLLNGKERRLNELQGFINQSYFSYNSGVNNIKIANKLDDEVKNMMKKLNIEKNSDDILNNNINNNVNNNTTSNNNSAGNNSNADGFKKKK